MRNMTLGARLGLSFGALILLMCVLGGLAVWRMNLAAVSSADLAAMRIPEVEIAHRVDAVVWEMIYSIRTYALSGDEQSLRKGRKKLAEVKEHLKVAEDLAKKYPCLVALRRGELQARDKVAEYETLVDQTEAARTSIDTQLSTWNATAKTYIQQCRALLTSEQQQLMTEVDEKAEPAKLKERLTKTGMIEELIDLILTIQINNFKAQAAADMEALRNTLKDFAAIEKAIANLVPVIRQEKDVELLRRIREDTDSARTAMEQILNSQVAIDEHNRKRGVVADDVVAVAGSVAGDGLEATAKATAEVADGLGLTSVILIVGLIVALIVAVLTAWLSTRAITGPIREGVNVLAATATEISATVSQLASSASEAAAAVAETTTTVDEVRQTAQVAADKAKAVADNAQGAARAADAGRQATDQTAGGLNRIRDQMASIGESITRLSEQSQAVGDIVSTVTNLAEQSNLLAVNASIEAAKAGDQGKGFAVVAQEIRSLAEQSKDSTKQVRAILTEVQKATGKAVLATEQGGKSVADGGKQAEEAGQAIRTLAETIQEATRAAVQIAASSQQQVIGVEQVARAMDSIKQATAQNAEGARQLEAATHNLQGVGARLKALVDAGGGAQQAT